MRAALLLALSAVAGAVVANSDTIFAGDFTLVLMGLGAAACAAVIALGPTACVAALAAIAASGVNVKLTEVAGAKMTLGDVFYAAALAWFALDWLACLSRGGTSTQKPPPFGLRMGALFIAYAGASVVYIAAVDPGRVAESFVSWLRFAQTASIAWVALRALRTPRDVRVVLVALVLGGTVAVVAATVGAVGSGSLGSHREGGFLGPNSLGLLGGVILTMGVFSALGSDKRQRAALIVLGLLALLLGKSVGATVGTGLALAVGLSFSRPAPPVQRAGSILVAAAVGLTLVFGTVQLLRPSATPISEDFRDSSTAQRAIVGAVGLEIFARHPIAGVGWRRSEEPSVISDRSVVAPVRARFQHAKDSFFPDVTPTSVHNSYIQILADLGIVGFGLFCAALIALFRASRRLLRRLSLSDPLAAPAWSIALALLLALVWLNDNPLYGGQIETVLVSLGVGMLAAISRIVAQRPIERTT